MTILTHFHGIPRTLQREVLLDIEESWRSHDVFVIQAPVAFGKSRTAHCIARWQNEAAIITPNNLLVNQYKETHDDLATLPKRSSFQCTDFPTSSCEVVNRSRTKHCRNCQYNVCRGAFNRAPRYVANYYTYLAHKNWRQTLIADEAHNLLQMLTDDAGAKLWHHQYKYPNDIYTLADLLQWIEKDARRQDPRLAKVYQWIHRERDRLLVERTWLPYRGHQRECIRIRPIDARSLPPLLWNPHKVRKIVLMSATISTQDIKDLGLDDKRVRYIEADSPIPAANRLIKYEPTAKISYHTMDAAIPMIADKLRMLLARHPDRGVIHVTYQMARQLRAHLKDDRLIWHSQETKAAQYAAFRRGEPGKVLVACGMTEGIDLPADLGRWQAICKIPYLSLGDAAVRHKMQFEPTWYQWSAVRGIIQASGRICRTPNDYGITYILDKSWEYLYRNNPLLFPTWWRTAYVEA